MTNVTYNEWILESASSPFLRGLSNSIFSKNGAATVGMGTYGALAGAGMAAITGGSLPAGISAGALGAMGLYRFSQIGKGKRGRPKGTTKVNKNNLDYEREINIDRPRAPVHNTPHLPPNIDQDAIDRTIRRAIDQKMKNLPRANIAEPKRIKTSQPNRIETPQPNRIKTSQLKRIEPPQPKISETDASLRKIAEFLEMNIDPPQSTIKSHVIEGIVRKDPKARYGYRINDGKVVTFLEKTIRLPAAVSADFATQGIVTRDNSARFRYRINDGKVDIFVKAFPQAIQIEKNTNRDLKLAAMKKAAAKKQAAERSLSITYDKNEASKNLKEEQEILKYNDFMKGKK